MIDQKIESVNRVAEMATLCPGVVISSRIRLARNLCDVPFPGWASDDQLSEVVRRVFEAAGNVALLRPALKAGVLELDAMQRELLRERHLVSSSFSTRRKHAGLILARDESFAIMINEEDHLRIQVMAPGRCLQSLWRLANRIDDGLDQFLPMAFSHRFGYLTVCPSNVGTGMRASVMVHLPALVLLDEIEQVARGLDFLGFTVRGWGGEGTDAWGNMYQISNYATLGRSEKDTIDWLDDAVAEMIMHETNARGRLLAQRSDFLVDQVARAVGILRFARLIPSEEALNFLSMLRLGVELDIVDGTTVETVAGLMRSVQPAHLQKIKEVRAETDRRDALRAGLIREELKNVTVKERI